MTSKIPTRHRAAGHREASAIITSYLAALDFPMKKSDLARKVGDAPVPVKGNVAMPLSEMLDMVRADEFENAGEVQAALDATWQEFRAAAGLQAPPAPTMTPPGEGATHGR